MDIRGMRYVVYIESVLQRISLSNVLVLKMDSDRHLHTDILTFANSFAVGVSYYSAGVICLYIFVVEREGGGGMERCKYSSRQIFCFSNECRNVLCEIFRFTSLG